MSAERREQAVGVLASLLRNLLERERHYGRDRDPPEVSAS